MQDFATCEPRLYPIIETVYVLKGILNAKEHANNCPAYFAFCFAF